MLTGNAIQNARSAPMATDNEGLAARTRSEQHCRHFAVASAGNLPSVSTARSSRQRRLIRRDRHGRGLRGPLYPASLPAATSRAEKFDQLVLDALEPIEARWRDQLTKLDVAVDDVPEVRGQAAEETEGVLHDGAVPLSRLVPAGVDRTGMPTRARIVLYRRPLEARAKDPAELAELVHDVLVEQVAGYLGVEPDIIEGD